MAKRRGGQFTFNRAAWDQIRKQQPVDYFVLQMAVDARDECERWASTHILNQDPPHFRVIKEKGEHRARFTVRPNTAASTNLVKKHPADFMACLNAARRD